MIKNLNNNVRKDVLDCIRTLPDIGDSGVKKLEENNLYSVDNGRTTIKSMLSDFEAAVIYVLGKKYYSGTGYIIDAGCLFGLSTYCFSSGLLKNRKIADDVKPIQSFDLYQIDPPYDSFSGDYYTPGPTTNALPVFLDINRNNIDMISPHQGDFHNWKWNEKYEIEIIFNDISKTVELNNHIFNQYISNLIPGNSFLIQQDYVHFAEWWIAASMEYYKDLFDEIGYYFGATKLFHTRPEPVNHVAQFDLRDLSFSTIERLLISAMERAPTTVSEALQTALGMFYVDSGKYDLALQTVLPMKLNEEIMAELIHADVPAHENFARVLPSNRRKVIQYATEKKPTQGSWRPGTQY